MNKLEWPTTPCGSLELNMDDFRELSKEDALQRLFTDIHYLAGLYMGTRDMAETLKQCLEMRHKPEGGS